MPAPFRKSSSPADRGKAAEGQVKDHLKALNDRHMHFCYNRNLDAHAAGGKFQAQAGDFQAFSWPAASGWEAQGGEGQRPASRNFIIEVKEVKHDFRLPHGNYSVDKVARVEKRVHAGTEAIVLVRFTKAPVPYWRAVPHEVFRTRTGGSWDLSAYPIVDMKKALSDFLGVHL